MLLLKVKKITRFKANQVELNVVCVGSKAEFSMNLNCRNGAESQCLLTNMNSKTLIYIPSMFQVCQEPQLRRPKWLSMVVTTVTEHETFYKFDKTPWLHFKRLFGCLSTVYGIIITKVFLYRIWKVWSKASWKNKQIVYSLVIFKKRCRRANYLSGVDSFRYSNVQQSEEAELDGLQSHCLLRSN